MTKYYIIESKNGDEFISDPYETAEAAVKAADAEWNHLSSYDKRNRESFVVAEFDTFDDDGNPDWMVGYNIIKNYK